MPMNEGEAVSWDALAVVGRIARAHGNRGQVIINPETDFPEQRFRDGNLLYANIDGRVRSFRIVAARFHAGRPVVLLGGVDTMTQAETLAGVELRVPETELAALPPDTYYHHELIGCAVRTADGMPVGTVTEVHRAAGAHRLLVRPCGEAAGTDAEIDVPLVEPICVRVDPEHGLIVVDPPDGLLELNRRR
jgi:16S rRNA processing protein RimM